MIKLKTGTYVMVADSEKALFFENVGDTESPNFEVRRKKEQDNPPNREQAANRRGRFNDGPSVHRSAVDDTDWHELAKERFADDLAEILYKQAYGGTFKEIVLIAEPQLLGNLRTKLHTEVEKRIVAEVPKNLTDHPIEKIEKVVIEHLHG